MKSINYVNLLGKHNLTSLTYRIVAASSSFLNELIQYRVDSSSLQPQTHFTISPYNGRFRISAARSNLLKRIALNTYSCQFEWLLHRVFI